MGIIYHEIEISKGLPDNISLVIVDLEIDYETDHQYQTMTDPEMHSCDWEPDWSWKKVSVYDGNDDPLPLTDELKETLSKRIIEAAEEVSEEITEICFEHEAESSMDDRY